MAKKYMLSEKSYASLRGLFRRVDAIEGQTSGAKMSAGGAMPRRSGGGPMDAPPKHVPFEIRWSESENCLLMWMTADMLVINGIPRVPCAYDWLVYGGGYGWSRLAGSGKGSAGVWLTIEWGDGEESSWSALQFNVVTDPPPSQGNMRILKIADVSFVEDGTVLIHQHVSGAIVFDHGGGAAEPQLPAPFDLELNNDGTAKAVKGGYLQIGGFTLNVPGAELVYPETEPPKMVEACPRYICVRVSSTSYEMADTAEIVVYMSFGEMSVAQTDLTTMIIPLYELTDDRKPAMDLRRMPTTGMLEGYPEA